MLFIKKKAKDAEILAAKAAEETKAAEEVQEAPKIEFVKCPKCGKEVEKERVKNAKYICYECGSYFRVKTKNRIKMSQIPSHLSRGSRICQAQILLELRDMRRKSQLHRRRQTSKKLLL